jgi:hypothetical protein
MKKSLLYIISVFLAACQKDFDEVKDTNLRHIDFLVDTSSLLSDVLFPQGNTFRIGVADSITTAHRIRISGFCYDSTGALVASQHSITESLGQTTMPFRHLLKQTNYHFVFLSDVVRTNDYMDYQEIWYQLSTKHRNTAYLFSNAMSNTVVENVLSRATTDLEPANQSADISLQPVTYNGYVVLTNTRGVNKLSGSYTYNASLMTDDLSARKNAESVFANFYSNGTDVLWPVTLTQNDAELLFSLDISTSTKGVQVTTQDITLKQRRPFVVYFDCSSLQITDIRYY